MILSSYTNTENAIGQSTVAAGKITAVSVRSLPLSFDCEFQPIAISAVIYFSAGKAVRKTYYICKVVTCPHRTSRLCSVQASLAAISPRDPDKPKTVRRVVRLPLCPRHRRVGDGYRRFSARIMFRAAVQQEFNRDSPLSLSLPLCPHSIPRIAVAAPLSHAVDRRVANHAEENSQHQGGSGQAALVCQAM